MVIDVCNLTNKEIEFISQEPVIQIQAVDFNLNDSGQLALVKGFPKIMRKCLNRERYEQLMTKDEYYINAKGELLIVLFDEQFTPFVVLDFQSTQYELKKQ
ncbi:hypothetical protein JCM30760_09970 [Thiomicrorhabdus hydrogeniphila]